MNITKHELTALKTCIYHKTREEQLSDNVSCGDQEAIKKVLGLDDNQVAELIGSLEKKGLVFSEAHDELVSPTKWGKITVVWITEEGVNVVFDTTEKENENLQNR